MANEIAKAYVQIVPTATGVQESLTDIMNGSANQAGKSAGSTFSSSFASSTKTAAAAIAPVSNAARGLVEDVISTSANFDMQMSKVQAISGAYGDDLDALRDLAMEMGRTTKFSAIEAGEALEYMGMAGWKSDQMIAGLPGILNLAAAAGEDLGTTSDIVTDAMTAFGYGAEDAARFSDILAAAATNSNTNVSMLGDSFRYAASLGGAMKFSAEDVAVALGLMANTGIKSSQAGVALKNVMQRLAKPTKESAEAMDALGITIDDGNGNMLSFRQIMDQMRESLGGIEYDQQAYNEQLAELNRQLDAGEITETEYEKKTEELAATTLKAADAQKAMYAAQLSGSYGLAGLLGIVNASEEDYQALCDAIDNSSEAMVMTTEGAVIPLSQALAEGTEYTQQFNGTAEAMASIMQDNLNGRMKSIESRMESIKISLGEKIMPLLEKFADWAIKALDWFGSLDEDTQSLIVGALGIAAVATPLLSIVGTLGSGIGTLVSVGEKLVTTVVPGMINAFSSLTGSMSGVTSVLSGLATAALGAADAILVAYDAKTLIEASKTYEEAQEAHNRETETALENFAKLYEEKGPEVAAKWAEMVYQIDTAGMSMDEAQKALAEKIDGYWEDVPESMWEGFEQGWDHYFGKDGEGVTALLGDAFSGAVDGVCDMLGIHSPSTVFEDIGMNTVLGYQEGVDRNTDAMLADMASISTAIVDTFTNITPSMNRVGLSMMEGLTNGMESASRRLLQTANRIAETVTRTVRRSFRINSPSKVFEGIGTNLMAGMELGMEEGRNDALEAARNITSDVTITASAKSAQVQTGIDNTRNTQTGAATTRNLTVIMELNKTELGRAVYQLNEEQTQRVGVRLAGGFV